MQYQDTSPTLAKKVPADTQAPFSGHWAFSTIRRAGGFIQWPKTGISIMYASPPGA